MARLPGIGGLGDMVALALVPGRAESYQVAYGNNPQICETAGEIAALRTVTYTLIAAPFVAHALTGSFDATTCAVATMTPIILAVTSSYYLAKTTMATAETINATILNEQVQQRERAEWSNESITGRVYGIVCAVLERIGPVFNLVRAFKR